MGPGWEINRICNAIKCERNKIRNPYKRRLLRKGKVNDAGVLCLNGRNCTPGYYEVNIGKLVVLLPVSYHGILEQWGDEWKILNPVL